MHRLRGMFAFAIWDRKKQTMFLARDHVGVKPMFYSLLPNGLFVFGSELKTLLCFPNLPREIDPLVVVLVLVSSGWSKRSAGRRWRSWSSLGGG